MGMLRPISILFLFDKIMQIIISELIVDDMKSNLDPKQFGNRKHLSIQHYLIRMLHRVTTSLDNNSRGEVNAVLCMTVDLKQAYSRQFHTLGIQSFLKNGVRPSLIPLLISYFEDRKMRVKWHNKLSETRAMPGSGAMGSSLGNWEFISQTNDFADCVPETDRFKFVDDLTTLEVINLINISLASHNMKYQVPSDISSPGQIIPANHLKSQFYLNELNKWADSKK